MHNKRIYLSSPTVNGKEMQFIQEAFDSNWIAPLGKNVDEFEKEISSYIGVGHAAALNSGTAGLHLALKYTKATVGDIVLCSDLTFAATCNPILYEHATPVFIDSERDSWNMNPALLRKAFEYFQNVKAVIVTNLYGTPAKLDEILSICQEYQACLIEDAAESLGARYKGSQTGSYGDFGIFSFNGNKIITSSGGGMVVSENNEAIKKIRFWSTQSREAERHYEHKEIGYNYRMSNIVAGIGRGQLKSLESYINKKKEIYQAYQKAFNEYDFVNMNPIPPYCDANYWLSCLTLKDTANIRPIDIMNALEKENIESRPIWKPMHLQPVFRDFQCMTEAGLKNNHERFETVSQDIFENGLCLPSDIKNTEEDMANIIRIIKKHLEG